MRVVGLLETPCMSFLLDYHFVDFPCGCDYFDGSAQEEQMEEPGAWSRHGPEKGIFQCGLQQ